MKPPRFRWNLGQMMIGIAGLSLMFTMLGIVGGGLATFFLVLLLGPLKVAPGTPRLEAWAWSAALFPLLVLLAIGSTWLAARLALGHDPTQLDFQKSYGSPLISGAKVFTSFLAFLMPVSFVLCAFLHVAAAKRRTWTEPRPTPVQNGLKSLPGPSLWLGVFAFLCWDPFDLTNVVLK